ncbi:RidA family protein [Arenibaculum pallidiluteum]|uniref:RidA family protein n=1 Tax=Arenibaculum pallidiluteum TaxID=2812559 RepID=UPI001B3BA4C4|nr:RidA family protein [Arenibaculum pallidiluteum]
MDEGTRTPAVHRVLQPAGWPRPRGYANGIEARGRTVFVGGMIGWDQTGRFAAADLPGQVLQALRNIAAVLAEAGAGPEHVTRMTWYVTDMAAYRQAQREVGEAYRAVMGAHFPAMALVQVVSLVEPEAKVEIEATAVIPD